MGDSCLLHAFATAGIGQMHLEQLKDELSAKETSEESCMRLIDSAESDIAKIRSLVRYHFTMSMKEGT